MFVVVEIIVPEKQLLKDPGESLLFNCSAAVGTDPKFIKNVHWHHPGKSPMPEGAFSRTAAFADSKGYLMASLSIPNVDNSPAGIYCGSVEPPVEHFFVETAHCEPFRLLVNGKIFILVSQQRAKGYT